MDPWTAATLATAEKCWTAMVGVIEDLADPDVHRRLPVAGSNSPYAVAHHCVEMTRWWLGTLGCGLDLPRDRASEFSATGTVDDLLVRIEATRADMERWSVQMVRDGIACRDAQGTTADVDLATVTPQWVLLHVVHELAQHLGQMQIPRDILLT
ncbi:DUF664 domain-containing protein [Gordonia sp. DT219]|uniref:mycothiol transferase n=1 Tax=Gordonia sp. DT219 TaxID=3416658 RepID=UPI003CED9B23